MSIDEVVPGALPEPVPTALRLLPANLCAPGPSAEGSRTDGRDAPDVEEIAPYYAALAPVYRAHGIRFWNNVETFTSPWPSPSKTEITELGNPIWSKTNHWASTEL